MSPQKTVVHMLLVYICTTDTISIFFSIFVYFLKGLFMNICLNPIICRRQFNKKSQKFEMVDFTSFDNFINIYKMTKDDFYDYMKNLDNFKFKIHNIEYYMLPCRKCVNCQKKRSREWAIRNTLEACDYDDNQKMFITLTYDDHSLNKFKINLNNGKILEIPQLNVRDVQLFLKSLRKRFIQYKIRFYLCGEYGSKTFRPHYHILLYGLPISAISDLDFLYSSNGNNYYNSQIFEDLWKKGFVVISNFSNYTAMYTARYCTKKINDNQSITHGHYIDNKDEFERFLQEFKKEFNTMSRRPGIAYNYYITHKDDIYKNDEFLFHFDDTTLTLKPLKFFDRLYDIENPDHYNFIVQNRKHFSKQYEYFKNIESNLPILEYLKNEEELVYKKLKERSIC